MGGQGGARGWGLDRRAAPGAPALLELGLLRGGPPAWRVSRQAKRSKAGRDRPEPSLLLRPKQRKPSVQYAHAPPQVVLNRRWAYRQLFESEEAAARAYDAAIWRLRPRDAGGYANFRDTCPADVAAALRRADKVRPRAVAWRGAGRGGAGIGSRAGGAGPGWGAAGPRGAGGTPRGPPPSRHGQ